MRVRRFPFPPHTNGTRVWQRRWRSLALSRSRARGVAWRWRLRWRSVVPRMTCVTRAARLSLSRARHHRASCASSPFSVPPAHDRHARVAAAAALARSLDRVRRRSITSRARGRASRTPLITRVHARTRARNHRASRASSPFPFPDVTHTPTRAHGNGGGALLFARTHGGVGSGGGGCGGGGAGGAAEGVWRAHWRMWR